MKGSDTMVVLVQRWAEDYRDKNAQVTISVSGGGSGTGIAALLNGSTEMAMSSRELKATEVAEASKKLRKGLNAHRVALDAIGVYVHDSSKVETLTLEQLGDIFTGRITNWKDVGGDDAAITLCSRENNSGTYVYFKDTVLGDRDFSKDMQMLPGTAAVIAAVSKDKTAIGFGGCAVAKGTRILKLRLHSKAEAIEPLKKTIQDGSYPLSRALYLITVGEPEGRIKEFLEWVVGEEGQAVCEKTGYIPLAKK